MTTVSRDWTKLKQILRWAWENPYSSFYRDKYKKAGIRSCKDIKTIEDFKKLPFLTRQELIDTNPYERFFLAKKHIETFRITSGTSGGDKPLILLKSPPTPKQVRLYMEKPIKLKVKSWLFLYQPLIVFGRIIRESYFSKHGIIRIPGDLSNLALTAKVAASLKVDAIQSTATSLYFLLPYLQKEYDLGKIKYVSLGGEYCSEQKLKFLKSQLTHAYFHLIFGSPESNWRAFRCKHLEERATSIFHPLTSELYFEVLDQKDENELVLTHLIPQDFPLIRYKTGDTIRTHDYSCPCGHKQIIEVFGRLGSDVIRVHGATIYAMHIDKALAPFQQYLVNQDWQLHVYEEIKDNNILPRLKLQLILKKAEGVQALQLRIAKEISSALFVSPRLTLASLVEKKMFLPLEVEFVTSLTTGAKQKHIISHLK